MSTQMPALSDQPLRLGIVLFPGLTLLDLAGPQAALGMHAQTLLFWKTLDPVLTDSGVSLTLLAELRGEQVAKVTQLMMEYDPQPPFNTGHPGVAGPELTKVALEGMGQEEIQRGLEIAKSRRSRQPACDLSPSTTDK